MNDMSQESAPVTDRERQLEQLVLSLTRAHACEVARIHREHADELAVQAYEYQTKQMEMLQERITQSTQSTDAIAKLKGSITMLRGSVIVIACIAVMLGISNIYQLLT